MSRKFWLLIGVLTMLMLALEYQMPRRFVWEPTFAHADRQPLGCYVFDSVLTTTMPHGYTVCRKTLSQLALEKAPPRSIVILYGASGVYNITINVDTLLSLAARGNRILVASQYFSHEFCDTLRIYCESHNYFTAKLLAEGSQQRDTVFWTSDTQQYPSAAYLVHSLFINAHFIHSTASESLAKIHNGDVIDYNEEYLNKLIPRTGNDTLKARVADVVALRHPVGRGELILVTTPMMMTNYGILTNPAYVHRLMNHLKDLPVVRTEAYMPNYNTAETSPFRELLKRPPLRWALYLVLLGVVLLMGFSARRRQRAIPVEAPPRNYQLEFIRHIGTLQYMKQKKIIWKKKKKEKEEEA